MPAALSEPAFGLSFLHSAFLSSVARAPSRVRAWKAVTPAREAPSAAILRRVDFLLHFLSNRIAFGGGMIYHADTHTHYGLKSRASGRGGEPQNFP